MLFESIPLKAVMHERKTIKFDDKGKYSTKDKGEIKTLGGAIGVTEVKEGKAK